ncbi:MAG: ABC-type lipoprotein export system ATPase subunit [Spirosomataceae bacterium]|jgi:putative ABC transport system ATP-binding protein
MLSVQNLSFSYQSNKSFNFPDLHATINEPTLILGNSGKGKTTLLHLLGLLLKPESGSVVINDTELTGLSVKETTQFRAENIGIIFQQPHFISSLNVLDNLLVANYLGDKKLQKDKAKSLATELGFEELLNKRINRLSGGEQQRVGIARALMNNPKVVLADEPTSNLDDDNCERVINLLTKQAEAIGSALIIVTHDGRLKERFAKQVALG